MLIRPALLAAAVLTLPIALVIAPAAVASTSDADLIRPDHVAAADTPQAAAAVLTARRYADPVKQAAQLVLLYFV